MYLLFTGIAVIAYLFLFPKPIMNYLTKFTDEKKEVFKTFFFEEIRKIKTADLKGFSPNILYTIASVETGFGTGKVYLNTKNLFSITKGAWQGKTYTNSLGFVFRVYENYTDSILDFVNLITSAKRYAAALSVKDNPYMFFAELKKAGYETTEPLYVDILSENYKSNFA